MLGGGVLGALGKTLGAAYGRSKDVEAKSIEVAAHDREEEREITAEFAIEERSDRRRMEAEIRELREELRVVSVELAHAKAAESDRTTLLEMVSVLRTQVDMQSQLIERQKRQIDDLVRRLITHVEMP